MKDEAMRWIPELEAGTISDTRAENNEPIHQPLFPFRKGGG
jgi:hypothetical protein